MSGSGTVGSGSGLERMDMVWATFYFDWSLKQNAGFCHLLGFEIIHLIVGKLTLCIGSRMPFVFSSTSMRKKQPNILLERMPANRYADDGANDKDIMISSLLMPYVQMCWPKFDLIKLRTTVWNSNERTTDQCFHPQNHTMQLWIWMFQHLLIVFTALQTPYAPIIVPHLDRATVESLWMKQLVRVFRKSKPNKKLCIRLWWVHRKCNNWKLKYAILTFLEIG